MSDIKIKQVKLGSNFAGHGIVQIYNEHVKACFLKL